MNGSLAGLFRYEGEPMDDQYDEDDVEATPASKEFVADLVKRAHTAYMAEVADAAAEQGKKRLSRRLEAFTMDEGSERLYWLSAGLDDLEKTRTAIGNRIHALFRLAGGGDDPLDSVLLSIGPAALFSIRQQFVNVVSAEEWAIRSLEDAMAAHPLGPFAASIPGLGAKQIGRLLGAIGDPYLQKVPAARDEDGTPVAWAERPRTVSALWAYAGLHVQQIEPASHPASDTHTRDAGGFTSSPGGDADHRRYDAHAGAVGVAPRRVKGQKAPWKSEIKKRAWLAAQSTLKVRCAACAASGQEAKSANGGKAPGWRVPPTGCTCAVDGYRYRVVFDRTRIHYADAVHLVACAQCGPKGKPAAPGSPLSDGHKKARATRAVMKEILRDLWLAARDWHLENMETDFAELEAAMDPTVS